MILIPLKSSNISAAGHENNVLRVQFSNGTQYDYKGVSSEVFNDFIEAKSQGKFFHKNIKGVFKGARGRTTMADKCEEHSGCVNQIETNTSNIKTLFAKVTRIESRPPVWMSLAFAAALGVIGWLIKGA